MAINRFIVLEGIDGSGKTTIAHALVDRLNGEGIRAVYTNAIFPPYESVRREIHLNANPQASYFFYLSANCYASSKIVTMLETDWVICDRYVYTTNAYHRARGVAPILPPKALGLTMPDRAFEIVVSPLSLAVERVRARQAKTPSGNDAVRDEAFARAVTEDYRAAGLIAIDNSSDVPSKALDALYARLW